MDQSNFSSPQGGEKRQNRQKPLTSLPCTAAQILNTQHVDDRFMMDNIELHQVTIVGIVRSVKETSTRIEYFIDDMTGPPLDVRQFVDNDENTPEEEREVPARENMYVRVHGHVRSFQGKHHVMAFKISPITDMNELTTHMLEVVHSHLSLTRAASVMSSAPNQSISYGDMGGYSGARTDPGLSPIQAQVHRAISACADEQGVSITHLCEKLRGTPVNAIRDAVEFLSSEGHIYSTIDDEHFKSTESM